MAIARSLAGLMRTRAALWLGALLVLIAIATVVLWRPDYPMAPGVNRPLAGYITAGEKFGVRVGSGRSAARQVLEGRGSVYIDAEDCKSIRSLIDCVSGSQNDGYYINGPLHHGQIFVLYDRHDVVTGVVWEMHVLPYIDF